MPFYVGVSLVHIRVLGVRLMTPVLRVLFSFIHLVLCIIHVCVLYDVRGGMK